jgi:hypothetical protein
MPNNYQMIAQLVETGDDPFQKLDWRSALLRSEHGALKPLLANAITVFSHTPQFAGIIKLDDFASRIMLVGPTPWDSATSFVPRLWTGIDDIRAAEWLQRQGIAVNSKWPSKL